jgi:hypothetical protein
MTASGASAGTVLPLGTLTISRALAETLPAETLPVSAAASPIAMDS